jgi:activator of 2-hydroxyglutaryl-CoA dehydratase
MSDLISRKALLKTCEEAKGWWIYPSDVVSIIEDQPIAYDMDKAVEQLKVHAEKNLEIGTGGYGRSSIDLEKAIEIVKEGAVKDE